MPRKFKMPIRPAHRPSLTAGLDREVCGTNQRTRDEKRKARMRGRTNAPNRFTKSSAA